MIIKSFRFFIRYFTQGNNAEQNVRYFADDWGFHPYVEYSNVGTHSRSRAHIAVGTEAVKSYQKLNKVLHFNYLSRYNIFKFNLFY